MDNEQGAGKASLEDLKHGALEHYESVSRIAHHWNSFVPAAIEAYQEWISVEDRLPPNGDDVLAYVKYDEFPITARYINKRWKLGYSAMEYIESDCGHDSVLHKEYVTHWMPLPNPPQSVNS